jgi:hypothetical protein
MKLSTFPYPHPDTLTQEYIVRLGKELAKHGSDDPESADCLEIACKTVFIKNIIHGRYSADEAREIGQMILNIAIVWPRWNA